MVLFPENGKSKGTFRRIGTFKNILPEWERPTVAEMKANLEEYVEFVRNPGDTIVPEFYVRREQGGDCVVHLV
jgi:hypothetical protein